MSHAYASASPSSSFLLRGGGGHAKVVVDCLLSAGHKVIAVVDDKYEGELLGIQRVKKYDTSLSGDAKVIIAIGDNQVRKRLAQESFHPFGLAIHNSAIISQHAVVDAGSMILHGAVVQAGAHIGKHVIINTGAQVDHDCIIGDYVHIAPGAVLCGTITVGEGAMIGSRSVIIPGKKVGAWSIVGAGSVVTRDIPDFAVAYGNPARVVRYLRGG